MVEVTRREYIELSFSLPVVVAVDGFWHVSVALTNEKGTTNGNGAAPTKPQRSEVKEPTVKADGSPKNAAKADRYGPSVPEYGSKPEKDKGKKLGHEATGSSTDASSRDKATGDEDDEKGLKKYQDWLVVPTGFRDLTKTPKGVWEAYEKSSEFTDKFVLGLELFSIVRNSTEQNVSDKLPKIMGTSVSIATAGTMALVGEAIGVAALAGGPLVWAAAAGVTAYLAGKATEEHYEGQMPDLGAPLSKFVSDNRGIFVEKMKIEVQKTEFLNQAIKGSLDRSFSKIGLHKY